MGVREATDYKTKYRYRFLCCTILVAVATGMFFEVWQNFVMVNNQTGHLTGKGNYGMAIISYMAIFVLLLRYLGAYRIGVDRMANILAAIVLTIWVTNGIEIFVSCAITGEFRFAPAFIIRYLLLAIAQSVAEGLMMYGMVVIYRKKFPPLRILEIYGSYDNGLAAKVNTRADKYCVEKSVSVETDREILRTLIPLYDAVLINDVASEEKNDIEKYCYEIDKRVYFTPKISDILVRSAEEINLFDTPLMVCKNQGMNIYQKLNKRAFDILVTSIALIILSPLMFIVAIAIKLEDGGPVIYKQERCTLHNRRFMIYKFRSMIVDAEKDGRPHPAGEKDDRITKVGRFTRACRIDELPQLWNILIGDMSIVGPRPERVEHVEKYCAEIPEFRHRAKVRGGLTGYAQVYGKYNTTPLDKLKMDLTYITNYTFLLDLQIMFETVKILVQKEATEGFTEEKSAEMHSYDTESKESKAI
ncbi:MAG: sugar transferase [Acetatifactor sp.]|nr:sugar transferase [Acetatifactor sp.]